MKKIILFALLFHGLQGFAQKRVYIYNFSIKSVKIDYVTAITNAGGQFPNVMSTYTTPITIPAGGTYSMETTQTGYRFPFDSTVSSPAITGWQRKASASATPNTSLSAFNLTLSLGTGYKFDHIGLKLSSGSAYKVGNVTYIWSGKYGLC